MTKLFRQFTSLVLVLTIVLVSTAFSGGNYVSASGVSIEYIDELFREANTPESQIEQLDEDLKRFIYENSLSRGAVEYVNVTEEETGITPRTLGYTIPEDELLMEVYAFKNSSADVIDIYPIYEWLVPVRPRGKDYFGYSTHDSYSVVPNERSNLIWCKDSPSDSWSYPEAADYTGASLTGYEHSGASLGTPDYSLYLRGVFYFKADIDTPNPVKKIVLTYVHDTSWSSSLSYGISFGPFSISVTPSSNSVGYQTNIFNLDY